MTAGSGWVWLRHPDLPGRIIQVRESGAAMRRAAGWVPTAPPDPEPAAKDEDRPNDDGGTEPEPSVKATPRRRRKSEKE